MEQTVNDLDGIVAKETWSAEDHKELQRLLFTMKDAPNKLRAVLAKMEAEAPEMKGAAALKTGIARYMLCRFTEAIEALAAATDNKERRYFSALCYKALRQYHKASEELARARDRGWEAIEVDLELIELQALGGQVDQADKALAKLEIKAKDSADYLYVRGLVDELSGMGGRAAANYQKARSIDPQDSRATFRLAYYYDLHGEEGEAVELYKQCVNHPPVHANALLNLAVLYEDAGLYDQAIRCLRHILSTHPGHARARLFLRDAEASKTMYYDEDKAKRIAKRNAVLDTPVTDFELSVRARNCLKKMNIYTLGDLVRTTEADLLSYKNFGETSLKEIKDMLVARNLHLGQALEEGSDLADELNHTAKAEVANEGVLATPIDRMEFSVRARRALDSLRVLTLGDLVAKTETELLSCRNFGQTSLNEVRQRLAEFGLELREPR